MRLLFALTFLAACSFTHAQTTQLDLGFGDQGRVLTSLGDKDDWIWASALQPDGKIIGAGYSTVGFVLRQALVRYLPDGSLDPDFGTNGSFVSPAEREVFALALHTDGTIVTAGAKPDANFFIGFAVSRFLADGTPDPAFGTNGSVRTWLGTVVDRALAVAVQPDGRIIAAGSSNTGNNNLDFALVRYATDGSLDPTFGNGGKVITAVSGGSDEIYSVLVQPDGKILVGGTSLQANKYYPILARYLADGSLDATFGNGGIVQGEEGEGVKALLLPDGRILMAGRKALVSVPDIFVWRFHADGSPDLTYGVNGRAEAKDIRANGATLQPDGKLVVVGLQQGLFAVARFLTDGSLDPTFGIAGTLRTDVSGTQQLAQAHDVHIQSDGRIVVTGEAYKNGAHNMAVTRYLPAISSAVEPATAFGEVQVFPNPITDQLTLAYALPSDTRVSISLTDLGGRVVSTLSAGEWQAAGRHRRTWSLPGDLPAGPLLLRLATAEGQHTQPLIRR